MRGTSIVHTTYNTGNREKVNKWLAGWPAFASAPADVTVVSHRNFGGENLMGRAGGVMTGKIQTLWKERAREREAGERGWKMPISTPFSRVCATNSANAHHFSVSLPKPLGNFLIMQVLFDYKSVEKVIEIRFATATVGRRQGNGTESI